MLHANWWIESLVLAKALGKEGQTCPPEKAGPTGSSRCSQSVPIGTIPTFPPWAE
ncbi:hypothetical protein YTPLAS18_16240 [Nitrospira sp.]|nr:hypothetical protein YTPLAS18_16240 [Nitrospira sp.]